VAELNDEDLRKRQYSSLDLCSPNSFTALVSDDGPTIMAINTALEMLGESQIPLEIVTYGKDFTLSTPSASGSWAAELELEQGGAALIRPDQHILAILKPGATTLDVAQAIGTHLGRPVKV
jgi:hypothetical protein